MATLPVPGEIFWNDYSFDLTDFAVFRNDEHIATYKGLKDNGYIFFKPNSDVQSGDVLSFDGKTVKVKYIENETHNGNVDLISAHY